MLDQECKEKVIFSTLKYSLSEKAMKSLFPVTLKTEFNYKYIKNSFAKRKEEKLKFYNMFLEFVKSKDKDFSKNFESYINVSLYKYPSETNYSLFVEFNPGIYLEFKHHSIDVSGIYYIVNSSEFIEMLNKKCKIELSLKDIKFDRFYREQVYH